MAGKCFMLIEGCLMQSLACVAAAVANLNSFSLLPLGRAWMTSLPFSNADFEGKRGASTVMFRGCSEAEVVAGSTDQRLHRHWIDFVSGINFPPNSEESGDGRCEMFTETKNHVINSFLNSYHEKSYVHKIKIEMSVYSIVMPLTLNAHEYFHCSLIGL